MEKFWHIVRIPKMWHRNMKWANVGKMAPIDLLDTNLQFVEKKEKTHNIWEGQ